MTHAGVSTYFTELERKFHNGFLNGSRCIERVTIFEIFSKVNTRITINRQIIFINDLFILNDVDAKDGRTKSILGEIKAKDTANFYLNNF